LFHWDLPAVLEDQGGWTNPASVDWFAEYSTLMVRKLGDRVPKWVTLNEPWVIIDAGYIQGQHPPGRRDWAAATLAAKNLLLAHGAVVRAFRSESNQQVGLVVNLVPVHAASEVRADQLAANRFDAYLNRQFLDPALLGEIPDELPEMFGDAWPKWTADELRQVRQPLDFVGVNYYLRLVVGDDASAGPARARIVPQPNCPHTAMDWEIYPRGLTQILQWLSERYGDVPLYITENGAAFDDSCEPNGSVNDPQRVEYLRGHLGAAKEAIAAGVNLRGYYLWSLLDNFEWACGFSKRFGIVHVDFNTQLRVLKSSARFYAEVIRTNGAAIDG
jgi:beta-glucosidase